MFPGDTTNTSHGKIDDGAAILSNSPGHHLCELQRRVALSALVISLLLSLHPITSVTDFSYLCPLERRCSSYYAPRHWALCWSMDHPPFWWDPPSAICRMCLIEVTGTLHWFCSHGS